MDMPDFSGFADFLEAHPELIVQPPRLEIFLPESWPPTAAEFQAILDRRDQLMMEYCARHTGRMLRAYHQWLSETGALPE